MHKSTYRLHAQPPPLQGKKKKPISNTEHREAGRPLSLPLPKEEE